MTKSLMNEAEQYLLRNWGEARALEQTMETVRVKYWGLFQQVVDAVQETHPDLDWSATYTQDAKWNIGEIGLGRRRWPGNDKKDYPSGFWIGNLRLERLTDERSDTVYSGIFWCSPTLQINSDLCRQQLDAEARTVFDAKEVILLANDDIVDGQLLNLAPLSKTDLVNSLLAGQGEGFVKILAERFCLLARFSACLDKVFKQCVKLK